MPRGMHLGGPTPSRPGDPRKRSEWLVRSAEGNQVGPVCLELIERGLYVGKVPEDAQVARVGSHDWWPVMSILPPPAPVSYASAAAILDESIDIPKERMGPQLLALAAAVGLSLVVATFWLLASAM